MYPVCPLPFTGPTLLVEVFLLLQSHFTIPPPQNLDLSRPSPIPLVRDLKTHKVVVVWNKVVVDGLPNNANSSNNTKCLDGVLLLTTLNMSGLITNPKNCFLHGEVRIRVIAY